MDSAATYDIIELLSIVTNKAFKHTYSIHLFTYLGFDEISTDLDSAATYDIIELLSIVTNKAFKHTYSIHLSTYLGFDEISTGLDSAATYDIIELLSIVTKAFKYTIAISLLQPPPDVFGLFDEVLVMSQGRLVYQGR